MQSFTPKGVCSTRIDFEITEDGKLHNLAFTKGCGGNAKGIAKLAEGRVAEEVIELFKGISCGGKPTSCPDQLAKALMLELDRRSSESESATTS